MAVAPIASDAVRYPRAGLWARLTALAFALGGAVHLTALLLLFRGIELYGHGYPAWRHLTMTAVDWLIAWIAFVQSPLLVFGLIAFAIEQLVVNGHALVPALVFAAALLNASTVGPVRVSPRRR